MTLAQGQTEAGTIESDLLSVGTVLKADARYSVPLHQRDFAWTLEEVDQMWNDIISAMESNRQDYFLGAIVVQDNKEDKIRTIIDGQQRLASLTMIFSAIRAICLANSDSERATFITTNYLGIIDFDTLETRARLTLNENNERDFQKLVVDDCSNEEVYDHARDRRKSKSNANLAKAVKYFRDAVAKKSNAELHYDKFLRELTKFISDRVRVILVRVPDASDAYLIFETLNDRGLDLSMSDLLKNYIFASARDQIKTVQKQWNDIVVRIEDENLTQFLRHYWLSKYGVVRERDLYKAMKGKFQTKPQVLDLMNELVDAADKYAAISNVDHQIWKGLKVNKTALRKDLEALQIFSLSQFRPLMLAGLSKLNSKEIPKLVRLIVILSIRYNIVGALGTGNIERAYSHAALAVRDSSANTAAKIFDKLRSAYPSVYPDDKRFKDDFSKLQCNKPKLARYILRCLVDEAVHEDEAKVNLEHIMPQKQNSNWAKAAADEEEYSSHVHRVGNLTLLEASVNSAAGNASFDDKKKAFSQSSIAMTRNLSKKSSWNISEIHHRQIQLSEKANRVWVWPPHRPRGREGD